MMAEFSGEECATGGADEHCITCGDEGIAMRVIELRDGAAVCADESRARHHVAVDLVEPVAIGDQLLVHAGVAIRHLGAGVRGDEVRRRVPQRRARPGARRARSSPRSSRAATTR